ncbi:unnamed protein product, partial [Symbiodinium sp. KB8]
LPKDPIPVLPEEDSGSLVIVSEGSPESGQLPRVRLRNREFEVIELVTWWAFDKCCSVCPGLTNPDLTELRIVRFILFLIFFNSICLASYDHRSESDSGRSPGSGCASSMPSIKRSSLQHKQSIKYLALNP